VPIFLHRVLTWVAGMLGLFAGFLCTLWLGLGPESSWFWPLSFLIGLPPSIGLVLLVSRVPLRCPQCGNRAFFDRELMNSLVLRCTRCGEVSVQRWTRD
jgi:hypothetical protein